MRAPTDMKIYGKTIKKGQVIRLRSIPWVSDKGGEKILSFLEGKVSKDSVILEFGSGGSTIWFAKNAKSVLAFEADSMWYKVITSALKNRRIKNAKVYLVSNYPKRIRRLLKENAYDLVLNDGQNRPLCCAMAMNAVKPGGLFITQDGQNVPVRRQVKMFMDAKWTYIPILEGRRAAWRKPRR